MTKRILVATDAVEFLTEYENYIKQGWTMVKCFSELYEGKDAELIWLVVEKEGE